MSKDTFYFSHDHNARQDPKIKKLLKTHGLFGYGVFWAIIEDLYNNANALPTDCDCIAFDLRCETEMVKSILYDFGLFEMDDTTFGSLSVQRRMDERDSKSVKARESARRRWDKKTTDANALPPQSDSNAIKERKGKEIKERKVNVFTPPTLEDVKTFFLENGYNNAEKVWNYYQDGNWKDSKGQQVLNWKQKMRGIWFKDENKVPETQLRNTVG